MHMRIFTGTGNQAARQARARQGPRAVDTALG